MKAFCSREKLKTIFLSLVAVCAMTFLEGCERKPAAAPVAVVPEVSVIEVKTEKVVLTTELPGRVTPFLVAEVRPQVEGIIQKRLFEEGSNVKEGELLYQIDPALYQAAYNKAVADLRKTEAKITALRSKFDRYKVLSASKVISRQEFDDAESDLKTASADIQSCQAAVETVRINLGYTKITAPISGRVGKSHITVGSLVTDSQILPLATIQRIDPVYVDVTQSSVNLLRLRQSIAKGLIKSDNSEKTKVKLILEDGTEYPLDGTPRFQDITVDHSTGSFILRIVFPNPDGILLPGMFVRAVVKMGVNEHAILVPQQAVFRDPKGRPVALTVDAEGKVGQRLLAVDRTIGDKWLVSAGLKPGDRVVAEGIQKARPGTAVKAVPFEDDQATPNKNLAKAAPSAAPAN